MTAVGTSDMVDNKVGCDDGISVVFFFCWNDDDEVVGSSVCWIEGGSRCAVL